MIELKDTVELMCSDDWRKRLVAEYAQSIIRYEKLRQFIKSKDKLTLADEDLIEQMHAMRVYKFYLSERLDKSIDGHLACRDIFRNIEMWVYQGKPLTLFDEKVEPIKLKGNDEEVEWHSRGAVDNGAGYLEQFWDSKSWSLKSPIFNSYEEAVKAWNEMVRKMNGDDE